jgi:probable HAF family extracellular repeat protein
MKRKTFLQRRLHTVPIALAIVSLLLAGLGTQAREQNQIRYYIEDLGTFSSSTRAYAINNSGQVVGYSFAAPAAAHAFRYTDGAGLVDLNQIAHENNAYGAGINSSGQVSGSVDRSGGAGGYHAFRYTDGVGLVDLGTLPGYAFSYGGAVNDQGQVVGSANRSSSDVLRAFRFTDGVGMQDLGTLGGGSGAYGINNSGDVVGLSATRATPYGDYWNPGHAFLYTDAAGMVDLNKLIDRSLGWELRNANAINNRGQIVGYGLRNSTIHAFRYSTGAVEDLGTFVGGGFSYALGINDRGDVVGAAYLDGSGVGNFRAMLYTDRRGMQNLNNLIDPSLGWVLRQATGINERGQIAGWGEVNGQERAFRLTPLVGFYYDQ